MTISEHVQLTADSVLLSGIHGRQRRQERDIQKIDLQRARRYGMREPARNGRFKYTFGGIVFIYDPHQNREITSYKSKDVSLDSSGTKNAQPIILKKEEDYLSHEMLLLRIVKRDAMLKNKKQWTSHSVLVVDMSGSMRRDDVNGSRCRSDGVWMTLARDFVKRPLQNRTRSNTDLISVVLMKDDAEVILKYELTDWVLYNKFIDLRNWSEHRPEGPGNYMPALEAAELLLMKNQTSQCSLSLMFFSDGKPSDRGPFSEKMGEIASKFGRRLSVACIGMAEEGEDFSTLNNMVQEATAYGAVAHFGKPSLDADSLSNIITGLASSLTASKTEMTNLATGETRKIRMDITRERKDTPDDFILTSDWTSYKYPSSNFVNRIWSWSYSQDDFVRVADIRCGICWKNVDEARRFACSHCKAYNICYGCLTGKLMKKHRETQCKNFIGQIQSHKLTVKEVPSFNIAMKTQIFGEGAERIVRKCRFLDDAKKFIGPIMVAKESRFVPEIDYDENYGSKTYTMRMNYHKEFMRTQAIANRFAIEFNNAIEDLSVHFSNSRLVTKLVRNISKIKFLEPFVVETYTPKGEYNVLVEPMLDGTYQKFNDNMGMVKGQEKQVNTDDLLGPLGDLNIVNKKGQSGLKGLDIIAEEGSESDEEESDDEIIEEKKSAPEEGSYQFSKIKDEHIPQAFSHFSYEKSNRYLMVVDLQGILKTNMDGTKCYQLTDPVIHKRRNTKKKKKLHQFNFGRTVSKHFYYDNLFSLSFTI